MTGSKKIIERTLFEIFFEQSSQEFTGASLSKDFILARIKEKVPDTDWKNDIYVIIVKWQKKYKEMYKGVYNAYMACLEAGVEDTREICERKYQDGIRICVDKKFAPIYFDHDVKEWRVAINLQIYEEIMGDKVIMHHELRNEAAISIARHGGNLPSGVDSRNIVRDMIKETKKLEYRQK